MHPRSFPRLVSVYRSVVAASFVCVALLATTAAAQTAKSTKQDVADVMAVTGSASSARHCISGQASNVHGLGWINVNSRVTVRFESDFDPIAAILLLGIDTPDGRASYAIDDDSGGNLEPEIQFTTSMAANAALYVSGYRGTSGCYRYQLEILPSALSTPPAVSAPAKASAIQPRRIAGQASSAQHCIAGNSVANVHGIGHIAAGRGVAITFETDFDAVAGVTTVDLNAAAPDPRFSFDDDSGGSLAPELRFTTSQAGTLALFVGGYRATAGCYRYKVEIQ